MPSFMIQSLYYIGFIEQQNVKITLHEKDVRYIQTYVGERSLVKFMNLYLEVK